MIRNRIQYIHIWVFLSALICIYVLGGCRKNEDHAGRLYTISGRLMYDCNNEPFANARIRLYSRPLATADLTGRREESVSTKSDGSFSITYRNSSEGSDFTTDIQLIVILDDGTQVPVLSMIPAGADLDLGLLYLRNKVRLYVSLNLAGSYTETDSLYFGISPESFYVVHPVAGLKELKGVYEFVTKEQHYDRNSQAMSHVASYFSYALGADNYRESFRSSYTPLVEVYIPNGCSWSSSAIDTVRGTLP